MEVFFSNELKVFKIHLGEPPPPPPVSTEILAIF